jgi:hypothetical protein
LYGAGTAPNLLSGVTTIRTNASAYTPVLQVENTGSASDANKNVALFIGARGNASVIDDNTNIGIIQKSNIVGNFGLVNFFNASGNLSAFLGAEFNNHGATNNANLIFGTATTIKAKLFNTGNLVLQNGGTFTDAGFRLDVNGTARVSGALTLSSATPSITLGGDFTISNTVAPSRSISIDVLNSNINLLAGGFGEGMFIGGRLTTGRTDTNYVTPTGLFGTGSSRITAYDGNGNALIQAANNGNRSICLRPIQSVLIGDITTGNGTIYNAILRCDSTDRGFMPPRMTTTQKNAIASPTAGLMVFDTTLVKL